MINNAIVLLFPYSVGRCALVSHGDIIPPLAVAGLSITLQISVPSGLTSFLFSFLTYLLTANPNRPKSRTFYLDWLSETRPHYPSWSSNIGIHSYMLVNDISHESVYLDGILSLDSMGWKITFSEDLGMRFGISNEMRLHNHKKLWYDRFTSMYQAWYRSRAAPLHDRIAGATAK